MHPAYSNLICRCPAKRHVTHNMFTMLMNHILQIFQKWQNNIANKFLQVHCVCINELRNRHNNHKNADTGILFWYKFWTALFLKISCLRRNRLATHNRSHARRLDSWPDFMRLNCPLQYVPFQFLQSLFSLYRVMLIGGFTE